MDRTTHNQIAAGLKSGDRDAWQALYNAYAESIWRNVSRLMADTAAVEDVVQETFMAAARSARTYDKRRGSLWVWLWAIARRQVSLYYRKQKPTVSLDNALQWWQSLSPATQKLIQDCMYEGAVYQRKDNRAKDADRIKLLMDKGMQIEMHPDVDSFRAKVAGMQKMDLFAKPAVQSLLQRMLEATR